MSRDIKKERVIALAGLFQAAKAVASLAKSGSCDLQAYNTSIESLFTFSPDSTLDVYGGDIHNLHSGLTLLSQLSSNSSRNEYGETARYVINAITLEKMVSKQPDMLDVIRSRLEHIELKKNHFSDEEADISDKLSGLYQDTISKLRFRIQVTGNVDLLKQKRNSDKIRAMLFACIRSAMLWRQLGGSKWQLIFSRSEIEKISHELLHSNNPTQH